MPPAWFEPTIPASERPQTHADSAATVIGRNKLVNKIKIAVKGFFFSMAWQPLGGLGRLIFRGFTITLRHTTLGRTALDEGFEPTIPVSERPQTHALDRTATGIG
jgi:hypothetical protein